MFPGYKGDGVLMEGWIKLHRKSLESSVFQNANLWQVWSYCLMRANHKEAKILFNKKEETIKAGSFITGRESGSNDCNMNPNTFYWQLKTLENLNCIKIESRNKFSVVSIVNWKEYQITNNDDSDYNPINKGLNEGELEFSNNRLTTRQQQTNTDKNNKNEKNINRRKIKNIFSIENRPENLNGQSFYDNKFFFITKDFRDELMQRFSEKNLNDDILKNEFYKMEIWLEANGAKKNYKLFIVNWLSKVKPALPTSAQKFNFNFIGQSNEQTAN